MVTTSLCSAVSRASMVTTSLCSAVSQASMVTTSLCSAVSQVSMVTTSLFSAVSQASMVTKELLPPNGIADIFTLHTRLNPEEHRKVLYPDTIYVTAVRDPVGLFESLFNYFELQDSYGASLEDFLNWSYEVLLTNNFNSKIFIYLRKFSISDFSEDKYEVFLILNPVAIFERHCGKCYLKNGTCRR